MRRALARIAPATLALVALAALPGCTGDRFQAGPKPAWLAATPAPVRLRVALDRKHGAARTIGPEGGTITATGADGTYYTLVIPRGALLASARITMTPLARVDSLPLGGGAAAAVQLEPDGLRLMRLATLTIDSEREIPVAEQVSFAYFGQGEDAHLYPMAPDPRKVELKLAHFSGYGYGRAAPNDPGRIALQQATSLEARLSSQLAVTLNQARADALLGKDSDVDLGEVVGSAMEQYYEQALRGLLLTASTDDRMAECAMGRYLAWLRQLQLLGLVADADSKAPRTKLDRQADEAFDLSLKAYTNAFDKRRERAIKKCREGHDFAAIRELISLEREAALMGLSDEKSSRSFAEIQNCINFELDFASAWETTGPNGLRLAYDVRAKFETDGERKDGSLTLGEGPLTYASFVATGNPSRALIPTAPGGNSLGAAMFRLFRDGVTANYSPAGTIPGELALYGMEMETNVVERPGTNCSGEDEMQKVDSMALQSITIGIRRPAEITRLRGTSITGIPVNEVDTGYDWVRQWEHQHGDDKVDAPPGVVPTKGRDGEEEVGFYRVALKAKEPGVWRADYQSTDGALGWRGTERSSIVLRHAPKGQ